MIIDVHTHSASPKQEGVLRITNIRAGIDNPTCTYPFSYGIHPYDVEKVDLPFALSEIQRLDPIAIGEIGMDFRFPNSAGKQSLFFKKQVEKASLLKKPIIIHAVKSLPQILKIMTDYKISFAIHGFRGTSQQANAIIQNGGFISISPYYPKDTKELFQSFKENILLETDETDKDIMDHYAVFANICDISHNELETIIENNYLRWIGNKGPSCC